MIGVKPHSSRVHKNKKPDDSFESSGLQPGSATVARSGLKARSMPPLILRRLFHDAGSLASSGANARGFSPLDDARDLRV